MTNKPHDTYKDWYQKERNGFWFNSITGEESIWHPMCLEIAGPTYSKARNWCEKAASDRNKRNKPKLDQ